MDEEDGSDGDDDDSAEKQPDAMSQTEHFNPGDPAEIESQSTRTTRQQQINSDHRPLVIGHKRE
jgi:hypothetical protein